MSQTPGQPPSGQPMPYPPQFTAPQPPAQRRSWFARHRIMTTLGVFVLIGIIASAAGGGGDDAPPSSAGRQAVVGEDDATTDEQEPAAPAEEPEAEPAETLPGIGAVVADGKFEFTVTAVEPGGVRIGNDTFGQDAQGQFVLVHLTVRNIGTEAQYFDGSSQELFDTQGRTHSSDGSAAIYLDDSNSFLNQINPGNEVQGIVVFDVPADAQLASIELHDSPFSGGVTVALG